jgi:hypothetical protein
VNNWRQDGGHFFHAPTPPRSIAEEEQTANPSICYTAQAAAVNRSTTANERMDGCSSGNTMEDRPPEIFLEINFWEDESSENRQKHKA